MDSEKHKSQEPETPAARSALEWLDIVAKSALVLLAVGYVSGLLIVNFRLSDVAASYFSFPQSQYVLSGALWALMSALAYAIGEAIFYFAARGWSRPAETRSLKILSVIVGCVVIPLILVIAWIYIWTMLVGAGSFRFDPQWSALGGLIICFFGGISLLHGHNKHAHHIMKIIEDMRKGAPLMKNGDNPLFTVAYRVFLYGLTLRLYSAFVFPLLPQALGGGHPLAAEIILKGEHIELAKSLGLPTGYGGSIGAQSIIAETPDYFLLAAPSAIKGPEQRERSIRMSKDHVDAVIYLGPKREVQK